MKRSRLLSLATILAAWICGSLLASWFSGDVFAQAGMSLLRVGSVPVETGNGTAGSGTLRVAIASNGMPGNYAEDAAHSSGDQGHFALGVRRDANTTFVSADGDYSPLAIDANGNLKVNVITGGGGGSQFAEDAAHVSGDIGTLGLAVRRDANTTFVSTDGDYSPLAVDSAGSLKVAIISGAGSGGTAMADDAAFTVATTQGTPAFAMFDNVSPDSVDENDGGILRMSANRNLFVNLRDAAGNERGLNIDGSGNLSVATIVSALPTGANAIGKLAANSGIDIGDVDVTSIVPGTGATSQGKAFDAVAGATDTAIAVAAVRDDVTSTITPADGDYAPLRLNARGALWVDLETRLDSANDSVTVIPGAGATGLGKAEDAAHTSADVGIFALAVRHDTSSTGLGADGDYSALAVDANGRLWTTDTQTEDVAATTGDRGAFVLAIRTDTLAASSGTTGDYEALHTTALGGLWATLAPNASGGLTISRTLSAASTNATSVKASAGQVYSFNVINTNAAVRFLKIYNKASSPTVGTDTPVLTLAIPGSTAGGGFTWDVSYGIELTTGIAFALTTGVADADTGAVAANEITVNMLYK